MRINVMHINNNIVSRVRP